MAVGSPAYGSTIWKSFTSKLQSAQKTSFYPFEIAMLWLTESLFFTPFLSNFCGKNGFLFPLFYVPHRGNTFYPIKFIKIKGAATNLEFAAAPIYACFFSNSDYESARLNAVSIFSSERITMM